MFAMASSAAKKSKLEETEEKRKTRYSKEYEKEYDSVRKCNCGVRGSYYKFPCTACNIDLSCASGRRNDIYKHNLSERKVTRTSIKQ